MSESRGSRKKTAAVRGKGRPRTVRVRCAVWVRADGQWSAFGDRNFADDMAVGEARWRTDNGRPYAVRWIEADVPLPNEDTIEATTPTTNSPKSKRRTKR